MTNVPASHPAVEAAIRGWFDTDTGTQEGDMRAALNAALPHLESATEENLARLRDTPAGQALIAEGRGWTPTTERDRRALAIINDPTVPAGTRHILAKGIRLLHKLERLNKR